MVVLDIPMPESCEKCNAGSSCWYEAEIEEFSFRRAFCINGRDISDLDCSCRPDWCPLVEVEPKVIRERTSHTTWQEKTVYVRKSDAEKGSGT